MTNAQDRDLYDLLISHQCTRMFSNTEDVILHWMCGNTIEAAESLRDKLKEHCVEARELQRCVQENNKRYIRNAD